MPPDVLEVVVSVVVLAVLGNAVIGTFQLARLRREQGEVPPPLTS
jgi:hypothetical protein